MEHRSILDCLETIVNFPTIYRLANQNPREIMIQSGYSTLFSIITAENIFEYINQKTEVVENWIFYTEDIRHSPAWGFGQNKDGSWSVTYMAAGKLMQIFNYNDKFFACAQMIKMTFEEIRKNMKE